MVSEYTAPSSADLAKLVASLPLWAKEYFEERAGILEYEANYPRAEAERLAWKEVLIMQERHSPKPK